MLELEPHTALFQYFVPPARRRLIRDLTETSLLTNLELPYYIMAQSQLSIIILNFLNSDYYCIIVS